MDGDRDQIRKLKARTEVGMCNNRCLNQSQTFEIGSAAQKSAAGVAPITSIIR